MRKAIAAVCTAAALALPAAPALASDIPPPVGTERCPAPYTGGTIVWVRTAATGYQEFWFCIPGGPDASSEDASSARAGVKRCGGSGIIVWYYDLDNRYHEPINTCL